MKIYKIIKENNLKKLKVNKKQLASALHTAIMYRRTDALKLLIKAGANCNQMNILGERPLTIAAEFGYLDVVKLLIKNGANPLILDSHKKIALEGAIEFGWLEVVKYIVQTGLVYINKPCANGDTLLHIAARNGRKEIYKYLVENGANPRARNANGLTPRQLARKLGVSI